MSKCPCGFCHLHVHSEYSLLDGANRVKDLAKRAAEMEMPALALTDHGVMYGAIDFYEACKAQGIKPILGCCLPGQLIYTSHGVKPIEEIEVGDMVLTHRGRFRPVVRTMTRAFDGTIYGVRAANSNVVWLTDEHPVLVSDRKQENLDWVRADELSQRAGRAAQGRRGAGNWKSFAVFPRLRHEKMRLSNEVSLVDALDAAQYGERDGHIFKRKCFNTYDREIAFDLPVRVLATPQLADLLGIFVAEGSFMRDKLGRATSITWSFGLKRDRALAQRVVETLRDVFGLKCDWREREDKALLEVLCHSTVLARVLEAWCGSGAHGKKIPAFVFGWNDENIAAFLRGLADGDAKIDPKTGRVVLKMVARDVVYGARLLLARLGMTGKTAIFENAGHRAFMLTWSPNAAYRRHGTDDNYLYLPLKDVQEKHYAGPVYNFEVAEDNSYVTDFVLHNCEAYVAPRRHTDKDPHLDKQKNTHHLTLWAKNLQGYKNLVKLTTRAHLDGFYYRPRIDHELIAQHSEGIICGSACLGGEIPQLIAGNKFDEAVARAEKYREIFGKENFFLEMMDHDLHGQDEVNEKLISIHHKTGIPLIVSNDAHYLRAQDEEMHKILVAIGTNSTVQNATFNYGPNFYLKSADEMYARFKHIPEALDNTMRIADMVNLELDLKTTHFPNFDVPPGHNLESFFRLLCEQRFDKRYPVGHPRRDEASTRMKYEQQIIIDKGYPGYFLVVQDLINWSKDRGILVGCRGSAAGCLVSYVLGITNLDPLPYGLLFERFLNPDRVSTPDIDIDFPDKRRDEVMQYVSNKYGKDKVAQIITFGTLAARAAIRDTARATGLDLKIADNVAKLIPAIPGHPITIKQAVDQVKELGDLYASDSTVRNLCDSATQIEGMTRHASRHACGVVIGKESLDELVPLEEKDGDIITQYHAKAVEKIGLVKMDFLGLQNNTVINDTLELIETRHGTKIDLENIELNDKKVYDMLGRGDGIAVFQMEGTGMRGLLREMKPENLEHIIAQISLYRPGPMDEIPKYINGRHGGKVTYPHPKLEGVLKDTYGMLLYQEQVMQASQVLAGFTGGQSETLMKAMSKKKADDMAKMKPLFLEGCAKNGVSQNDANDIFSRMEEFAKYAFNKCIFAQTNLRLPDGSKMTIARAFREQPSEIMAMWPDGEIRPHRVLDIVQTGRKPLFKITTKKGRVVKATAEHRFLSTEGYKPAEELRVGMELMAEPESTTTSVALPLANGTRHFVTQSSGTDKHGWDAEFKPEIEEFEYSNLVLKPCQSVQSVSAKPPCPTQTAGVTRAQYAFSHDNSSAKRDMAEWLIAQNIEFEMHRVLDSGRICDFYFAGIYWEMDGMDRVTEYFEAKYGDLPFVVVTPEDFKFKVEHHLQLAHAQNGDEIVSIEPCESAMTYDIEMAPDGPLNYIANGLVSHNSHAAYYALVSYWTAFLKVNYPSEFLACKMTSLLEKKDKLLIIIDDCRKHGIEVLPPDVNESNHEFTVVEGGIRFGLQAIKGIGEAPVNAICEARREGGRFSSLFDFCARVSSRACGKGAIETLVKCGAFDGLHDNRQAMCEAIEGAISAGLQAQQDAASGQVNMFGDATEMGRPKASGNLPNVPDADRDVRLAWEKEYLGLYISDHPLLPLRGFLESDDIVQLGTASENPNLRDGSKVKVAGLVTTVKKMVDKNGRTWAAFTLEDLTGSMEILAFSKSYEKCGACVAEDAILTVSGRLTADNRRGKNFGGGGEDDDNGAPDAETIQYKIMADNIEVIDMKKAGAIAANEDSGTSSTRTAPQNNGNGFNGAENGVVANSDISSSNGANRNGNANGSMNNNGSNGNGAPVGGMSINRQTINGNGSAPVEYSNGNGNSNGANGNGHSNGNGSSNGNANGDSSGVSGGVSSGESSWHDEPLKIGRAFAPPVSASTCVHLYVAENKADADTLMRLWNICRAHPGETEVWLHLDNGLEMVQLRASHAFWVDGSPQFCQDVLQVLGDGCVLAPC